MLQDICPGQSLRHLQREARLQVRAKTVCCAWRLYSQGAAVSRGWTHADGLYYEWRLEVWAGRVPLSQFELFIFHWNWRLTVRTWSFSSNFKFFSWSGLVLTTSTGLRTTLSSCVSCHGSIQTTLTPTNCRSPPTEPKLSSNWVRGRDHHVAQKFNGNLVFDIN